MQTTLISSEGVNTIVLPGKVSGQYWVYNSENRPLVSIEGIDKKWILHSSRTISVLDPNSQPIKNIELQPLEIYRLAFANKNEDSIIFTEPTTEDRRTFTKYGSDTNVSLTIGRDSGSDILFNNQFVSSNHAILSYQNGVWSIRDCGSRNGTFVNRYRVDSVILAPGDVIYIMGLKIIIGSCYFAINNPDKEVVLNERVVGEFSRQDYIEAEDEYELEAPNYFYRSPRFKREYHKTTIRFDTPPANQIGEEMPLMLVIGPSITMGLASVTMAVFSISNALSSGGVSAAMPSIAMSFSMMLGTILWPVLSKRYDKNRRKQREQKRQDKYKEYLNDLALRMATEAVKQEHLLLENFIGVSDCVERIEKTSRNLWERSPSQNDFLQLRLGTGNKNADLDIQYSERRFTLDEDDLQERMLEICETPTILRNIPITVSLFTDNVSGIIGNHKETFDFVKGLILQLAALYSSDEVKMIFLYGEKDEDVFSFVKWLPHAWSDDKKHRFVAANDDDVKDISAYLEQVLDFRTEINENEVKEIPPYYIVFALEKGLEIRAEFVKQLLAKKRNLNFSAVFCYDALKELPKECSLVVELNGADGRLYDKENISDTVIVFKPDVSVHKDLHDISIKLDNIPVDVSTAAFSLPQLITFLEMYEVGKVEHLNVLTRWNDSDPTKTLEAFVGIDTYGKLFRLDLHEKFHGPHGLIAGMTGSGKSEFIITYILSLAVNYHPDEVAFILIDYKGGGMAKSFENLPHTAGIITNLDGGEIKRSLVSIQSELRRRQGIFAAVSARTGVSNIDIYKYQKLRREGIVTEPLQHLFIISDEFAELKTQQPEFMEQLISAARIGRSLGIHLVLATQKPSGVVDDQIWSNSRFRICLKVQERADSMDMLKRPDAAELTDTGRFYLQVGYNELFEMGQSAWAGAQYYPSEKPIVEKNNSVEVVSRTGHVISQAKPASKYQGIGDLKQLDAITAYLRRVADEEAISVKLLWCPPLPEVILLQDIRKRYSVHREPFVLNPIIGEYDDPVRQRQDVLTLPITEGGNIIVYGIAGSGKTTFLSTMMVSLIEDYAPNEVNLYVLDFAAETLKSFANAPHVGEVILSDEDERVQNLFLMLQEEVQVRKKLFADYGGDYLSFIENASEKVPNIVVVINNFAAFGELYENLEDTISRLTREGTKYGIYFTITAQSANAVRYRMAQNFTQVISLQLNDESEYNNIVGRTEGLYPAKYKGRGLVKREEIYEFHTAIVSDEKNPFRFIKDYCDQLGNENQTSAKKVFVAPGVVDAKTMREYITRGSLTLPIGVYSESAEVCLYNFSSHINLISSRSTAYGVPLGAIINLMADEACLDVTLLDAQNIIECRNEAVHIYSSLEECGVAVREWFELTVSRFNEHISNPAAIFEEKVFVITALTKMRNTFDSDDVDRLDLILEKGSAELGLAVIIADIDENLIFVASETWYRQNVPIGQGIWVGPGFSDQYRIEAENKREIPLRNISQIQGYAVNNSLARAVKFVSEMAEVSDNE